MGFEKGRAHVMSDAIMFQNTARKALFETKMAVQPHDAYAGLDASKHVYNRNVDISESDLVS